MAKYYKILNKNMVHNEMHYQEGLNIDIKPFNPKPECGPGGLFFADRSEIGKFFDYGMLLAEVEVPEGEPIVEVKGLDATKYKAHRIILKNIRDILDDSVIEEFKYDAEAINGLMLAAITRSDVKVIQCLLGRDADINRALAHRDRKAFD